MERLLAFFQKFFIFRLRLHSFILGSTFIVGWSLKIGLTTGEDFKLIALAKLGRPPDMYFMVSVVSIFFELKNCFPPLL